MDQPAPVASDSRIASLDIARGIAVLGILLLNVVGMGLPFAYEDPTNAGGASGWNLVAWRINTVLFEGTMRGLFTILFGASALLFLFRSLARNPQTSPAKYYYRRMLLLIGFGLINGYVFLWDGDILVFYGVTGMLLYWFRQCSAWQLLIAAGLVLLLQTGVTIYEYHRYHSLRIEAQQAQTSYERGEGLTLPQRQVLAEFQEQQQDFKPTESQIEAAVETMRASYASAFDYMRQRVWYTQTVGFMKHGIGDSLMLMLLGMALFKWGVLTGRAPRGTYIAMIVCGYGLGLCVNVYEMLLLEHSGFSVGAFVRSYVTYDVGRIPVTLGHLGLILLLCRSETLPNLKARLAAVGKMALTNYLAQSLICLFVFTGAGLALYGQLQRHQLYYLVLLIWAAQLWWSPRWLQRFRQGPVEWLWRKATYF